MKGWKMKNAGMLGGRDHLPDEETLTRFARAPVIIKTETDIQGRTNKQGIGKVQFTCGSGSDQLPIIELVGLQFSAAFSVRIFEPCVSNDKIICFQVCFEYLGKEISRLVLQDRALFEIVDRVLEFLSCSALYPDEVVVNFIHDERQFTGAKVAFPETICCDVF